MLRVERQVTPTEADLQFFTPVGTQFGIDQFQSYWRKLGARTKIAALGFASFGLLTGEILVLAFRFEDSWGGQCCYLYICLDFL